MKVIAIIPARFQSQRLPGKPLINIKGKSVLQRVYEQSIKCKSLDALFVATDDERIYNHTLAFGGQAIITNKKHSCGTDRCAEAVQEIKGLTQNDIILNIQADELFLQAAQLNLLINEFNVKEVHIATLINQIKTKDDLLNPNVVKVVINTHNQALYFSRSLIPYTHNKSANIPHYKHIGIYAFKYKTLKKIVALPPSGLEICEELEQLRWLENDFQIRCILSNIETYAINTKEDLETFLNKI